MIYKTHTYQTKDRVTRTPLKTGGELVQHLASTWVHPGISKRSVLLISLLFCIVFFSNVACLSGVTSGAGTAYPSGAHEFTSSF
jgi:hypothetical protein